MWTCLPFTYSQDKVAEFSPTCDLDTLQSVLSKSKTIPEEFCCSDNLTEFFRSFRFGMMSKNSDHETPRLPSFSAEQERSREISPSAVVSLADKTSALRGKAKGSKAKKADSGKSLPESFARFDQDTCGLKIPQLSLFEDWIPYSGTLPKWGTMRNGELFRRQMPSGLKEIRASITNAIESGLLVRFPTANCEGFRSDGELRMLARLFDEEELRQMAPRDAESKIQKALETRRLGTMTTSNRIRSDEFADDRSETPLEFAMRMPTLHGFSKDGLSNGPSGNELGLAVNESIRRLPTATAHTAKECNAPSESERNTPSLATECGGSLNPEWVEWYQGFPVGWSDLAPMCQRGLFQEWLHSPSWWKSEPEGVPRVAKGIKNCSKRIMGLGNAQVPHCCEMAWKYLFQN